MRTAIVALALAQGMIAGCALVHERDPRGIDAIDAGVRSDASAIADAADAARDAAVAPDAASAEVVFAELGCNGWSSGRYTSSWVFYFADASAGCDTAAMTARLQAWVDGDPPRLGHPARIRTGAGEGEGLARDARGMLSGTFTIESFSELGTATFSYDLASLDRSRHYTGSHVAVTRWCAISGCGSGP